MRLNVQETLRYLGVREADEATLRLIDACGQALLSAAEPAYTGRLYCIEREAGTVCIGGVRLTSVDLHRHLCGCTEAAVFTATLGAGVDALMRRCSVEEMSRAVTVSAAASALIEDWCDEATAPVIGEQRAKGLAARPRFSAGYGDFPLRYQGDMLTLSDARRIGVALTESSMLVPIKTVTAIIGFGESDGKSAANRCQACRKTDCPYRKD